MNGDRLNGRLFRASSMRWFLLVIAAGLAACGWFGLGVQIEAKSKSAILRSDPFADDEDEPQGIPEMPESAAPPAKKPAKKRSPVRKPDEANDAAPPPENKPAPRKKKPRVDEAVETEEFELPPELTSPRSKTAAADHPAQSTLKLPSLDEEPDLERPRLTREIKKTANPAKDVANVADDRELTDPAGRPRLSPLKNKTLDDKSGWKSAGELPKELEPGAPRTTAANGAKPGEPASEGARFEKDPVLEATQANIVAIEIEGNKSIKKHQITKLLHSRIGRPIDPKVVKEDVRSLTAKRWFYNVEARIAQTKEGPVLVFRVNEKPLVEKITFVGNHKIKDKELNELINRVDLKVGSGYDMGQNNEARLQILANYKEKGYQYATVELEKGSSPEDREVVFKINEGSKLVVTKIRFRGNKYFSSDVLKTQIKTKTQILWLFGGKYDPSSIQEDLAALREYYIHLGFFDVRIKNEEHFSEDKSKVVYEYVIEEGERYKVRNIEFIGNHVLSREELLDKMKVKPGQYWAERFIAVDRQKVEGQYGELGRMLASVQTRPRSYEEPGYVDLIYDIHEDRPIKIGKMNISIGAPGEGTRTKTNVVRNRLVTKPGDLANKALIDKSIQRLKFSPIFVGGMPGQQLGPNSAPPQINLVHSELEEGAGGSDVILTRGQSEPLEEVRRPEKSRTLTEKLAAAARSAKIKSIDADDSPQPPPSMFSVVRGQSAGEFYDDSSDGAVQDSPPGDEWGPEKPVYSDIDISVFEAQTGKLSMGVSVNSNYGLLGNVTLDENNFDLLRPPTSMEDLFSGNAWRGGGQQFRMTVAPGPRLSQYSVQWTDPYFLDQNFSLSVNGTYQTGYVRYWWQTNEGGRFSFGKQLSLNTSAQIQFRVEDVIITDPVTPTPPEIASSVGVKNFMTTVKGSLIHDTRDNAFLPGSGHWLKFDYEQAYGSFSYPKFGIEGKQYFLIHERPDGGSRQVLSVVGNFGWIGNDAPFFERFYAGGFATFRGFQLYGISPRVFGTPVGGQFQGLASIEYLLPVTADNTFSVVFFTDMGTVDSSVTFNNYRQTVGGGIRLMVPMLGQAPVAIDFAVPVIEQMGDVRQLVSFSMGWLK